MMKQIPFLGPPGLVRLSYTYDHSALPAGNWITRWEQQPIDVGLVGVPLAKASRNYAGVDGAPNAVRKLLNNFTTYDIERDADIGSLRVSHIGDVQLFATDVGRSQAQTEESLVALFSFKPRFLLAVLGGDQSVTYASFKAFRRARQLRTGLIFFGGYYAMRALPDDQRDSRPPAAAITDDSTIRALLEEGLLDGRNVVQIGAHGFRGSSEERQFAKAKAVTTITAGESLERGVDEIVSSALKIVGQGTEAIYLTVNLNALDLPHAPASQDGQFGGLRASDLFAAVYSLGTDPRVQAIDIVGADAYQDQQGLTIAATCGILLNFLAGVNARASKLSI
jgi:formiminoglutamase